VSTGADGRRPVVVVADDEGHIRLLLAELVEEVGAEAVAAADGEEALRAVRERSPALLLTDVMMPRLRGDDLCRRLKADPATAGLPVVLLSAVSPLDAAEVGADQFVSKPFDLDEVEELVRRYAPNPRRS
jgi:CheY-like chemotaxis protein